MKVLMINYTDGGGGGAIAPKHLYEALKKQNVNVSFGVVEKKSENQDIFTLPDSKNIFSKLKRKFLCKYEQFLFKHFKTTNGILHSLNLYSRIDIDFINNSDYDIIHLHWICGNSLSIKDIAKITKPVIWTMHDSWPVCGAEHHPNIFEQDQRYFIGYTKKNKPKTTCGFDLCRYIFNKKRKYFKKPIHFIAPSKWQAEICKKSFLFNKCHGASITHIPNILDIDCFCPLDEIMAKNILGLDNRKIVLMFSTPYFENTKNDMKGSGLLLKALEHFFTVNDSSKFVLLMTGNISMEIKKRLPHVQTVFTGFIQNPRLMNLAYNAANVLLLPSRIENLPYGLLEPQAVGVPCVAFDTGGNRNIVLHKKTGYLVPCFDIEDFAAGINFCIKNAETLSINAINHIKEHFNLKKVLNAHIELYKKIYTNCYKEE